MATKYSKCVNLSDPEFKAIQNKYGLEPYILETLTIVYRNRQDEKLSQAQLDAGEFSEAYPSDDFIVKNLRNDPAFNVQEEAKVYGIKPQTVKAAFPDRLPKDVLYEEGQNIVANHFTDNSIKLHLALGEGYRPLRNARKLTDRPLEEFFENLDMGKQYRKDQPEYWIQKQVAKTQKTFDKFYGKSIANVAKTKLRIKDSRQKNQNIVEQKAKDYFLDPSAKNSIKLFRELTIAYKRFRDNYYKADPSNIRFETKTKQLEQLEEGIDQMEYDLGMVRFTKYLNELIIKIEKDVEDEVFTTGKNSESINKRVEYLNEFVAFYRPMLEQIKDYMSEREAFVSNYESKIKDAVEELGNEMKVSLNEELAPEAKYDKLLQDMSIRMEQLKRTATKLVIDRNKINSFEGIDKYVTDDKVKVLEKDKVEDFSTKNDYDDNTFRKLFGSLGNSKSVFARIFHRKMRDANLEVQNFTLDLGEQIIAKAKELGIDRSKIGEKFTDKKDKHNFITKYDWHWARTNTDKELKAIHKKFGLPLNKDLANETLFLWQKHKNIYDNYMGFRRGAKATDYIVVKDDIVTLQSAPGKVKDADFEMTVENYLKSDEYANAKQLVNYRKEVNKVNKKYWTQHPEAHKIVQQNEKNWGANSLQFKQWEKDNVVYLDGDKKKPFYKNDLLVPRKENEDYKKLTDNERKFLNYLIDIKNQADSKIPFTTNLFRKPQIKSDWVNSVFKKGSIMEALREGFNFTKDSDDTMFGEEPIRRADGSVAYNIPTHFIRPVENADRLTNDIIGSVILYAQMAHNVQIKHKILPEYEILLSTIGQRDTYIKGQKKSGTDTNIYEEITNFMKAHLFGIFKDSPEQDTIRLFGKEISISKMADKLNSYFRNNNLAFRFSTALVGGMSSRINFVLERFTGEYTAKGTTRKASKTYWSNIHMVTKEMGRMKKTSKLSRMLQAYYVLQNADEIYSNTDFTSALGKKLATERGYTVYMPAEHGIKSISALAVMESHRLYNGKFYRQERLEAMGVEYQALPTYWEALDKTAKSFKSEYEVTDPKQERLDMQNKIATLNNLTDGRLNPEDKAAAHQDMLLQYVATHRGWLFKMFEKRFKGKGVNYETGEMEQGYYNGTGEFLKELFADRVASLKHAKAKFNELEPWQQQAVKRTMYETLMTMMFITFGTMLNYLADEDDEDSTASWVLDYMAYITTRTYIEFSTLQIVPATGIGINSEGRPELTTSMLPPMIVQSFDVIKSPVTGVNQLENLMDLTRFMEFAETVESGPYEGFTKGARALFKSFPGGKGITADLDPERSRKTIQSLTLEYWPD